MSKFLKALALLAAFTAVEAAAGTAFAAGKLGLGRPATPEEVKAWDIDIRPDGQGLPDGRGDVVTGEEVFAAKCAVCHGDFAEGVDRWPVLAGGQGTLASDDPVKTVGSYWPYLSTVWDYVYRAMPFGEAQSLTADEVYAITAYILYANDLVDDEFELSRENFAEVRMPNEDGFFMDDRGASPIFAAREVCMTDCKDDVQIVMRARVLDVTPDTGGSDAANAASAANASAAAAPANEKPVQTAAAPAEPPKPAYDEQLAEKGEKVFKKCKQCHQVGETAKNRVGPQLNGIVGATVGQVEKFRYSKIFKQKAEEGVVWDEANLHAFLEKPRKWAKGTRMSYAGLKKEADRQAVIEYLKKYSQ